LSNLLNIVYGEEGTLSSIKRMLPKLKRGVLDIDIATIAKLHLDLERDGSKHEGISFNYFGKKYYLYTQIYVLREMLKYTF